MIGIILKYSAFYHRQIPENPLTLLKHLPKTEILATITRINTLLQPHGYRNRDESRKTQFECLKTILLQDEKNITLDLQRKFEVYRQYLDTLPNHYIIFTRITCLYALNEILQSDTFLLAEKTQYTFEERIGIFDYLLICNEYILNFSDGEKLEKIEEAGVDFFEFFAFNALPYNQYVTNVNGLAKFYKSAFFLKCLTNEEYTNEPLRCYFQEKYGLDDIVEFFKTFMYSFLKMYDKNLKLFYLKIPKEQVAATKIVKGFSKATAIAKVNHYQVETLDFLPVKKSPIFSWEPTNSDEYTGFLVLDSTFLLEKMDSLLINDFWFDYLKDNSELNRKKWGGFIGTMFFEPFVNDILTNAFKKNPNYVLKTFNELKIQLPGKSEIEVSDVYIRNKQKIALIEVKSNFINMQDGYKSVTTLEEFKLLKMDKFYSSFGLKQMVTAIKNFHLNKSYIDDEGLNLNRKVHLYPIILVNEPILSGGLFNYPLRKRFESILKEEKIDLKSQEHIIWPLLIMNIEELQELEQSISDKDIDFFKILDSYHVKTSITGKIKPNKYKTMLTLYNIINEKVDSEKLFPHRLKDYKWLGTN